MTGDSKIRRDEVDLDLLFGSILKECYGEWIDGNAKECNVCPLSSECLARCMRRIRISTSIDPEQVRDALVYTSGRIPKGIRIC